MTKYGSFPTQMDPMICFGCPALPSGHYRAAAGNLGARFNDRPVLQRRDTA